MNSPTALPILIVEDDPAFGRLLEEIARDLGFAPERSATAESAWTAYARRAHPVVLTDWALPGEDGLALCRRIRESPTGPRTVTVIVTGRHQASEIEAVLASGANDYILKSSDPATLQIRIGLAARQAQALAAQADAEAATLGSELRFSAVATTVPVAILRADASGACVFANESWQWIAGATARDAIGDGWLSAVHPDDRTALRTAWEALARDGTGFRGEARFVATDGRLRWGAWTGVPLRRPDGSSDGHMVTVSDVSDRVSVEQALRAKEERLDLAGRGWNAGIWDWDVATDQLLCTERLVDMLGWGADRPVPATATAFAELVHPDDRERLTAWMRAHLAQRSPFSVDFRMHGRNGRWRWFNSRGQAVWDDAGVPVRMAGAMRDVTGRRRAELLLRRANRAEARARRQAEDRAGALARHAAELAEARNAALESTQLKSEFLATMSHELRTPLNGVIGMTSLLLDTPLSTDQREFAEQARASGTALLDLINDILDLSRIEAGHLELDDVDFGLPETVDEALMVVAERAESRGLELGAIVEPTLGAFAGDPRRLRQVLINLAGNAVKFTERGGVVVRVATVGTGTMQRIRFTVQDTGPGIEAAGVQRLFQAFVQVDGSLARRHGGTGLGLAISRRLVEAMGGTIGVTSEVGVGSVFWFEVPLRAARSPRATVDDDPPVDRRALCLTAGTITRDVLRHQLSRLGYAVDDVADVAAAGTRLRESTYDVLVVDDAAPRAATLVAEVAGRGAPGIVLLTPLASTTPTTGGVRSIRKPIRLAKLRAALGRPAISAAPSEGPMEATAIPSTRPLHILVAEDNATNQLLARIHLEKLGHRPDIVRDGRAAVEAALGTTYDLILMDCEMPELDGLEATREIRAHERTTGHHTPIIALTANAMVGDRERCLAAGMDDYVAKPLQRAILAEVMARNTSPAPDAAPVDDAVIARLRQETASNPDTFAALVDTYLDDVRTGCSEARDAIRERSGDRLGRAAHGLKGSSAAMGAHRLAGLCAALEQTARTSALADAPSLIAHIEEEATRVAVDLAQRSRP